MSIHPNPKTTPDQQVALEAAATRLHKEFEGKGTDGKPVVLFLVSTMPGRSQMALGFFNHHAGDQALALSAAPSRVTRSTALR